MAETKTLLISDELLEDIKNKWIPVEGFRITVDEFNRVDIQFTKDIELQLLLEQADNKEK